MFDISIYGFTGELLVGTYNDSEELGTTWWYEIKTRTDFAFRCSAFGHKERMASMKVKSRSCSLVSGAEAEEAETTLSLGMRGKKRNSYHIHYPGW